MCRNLSFFVYMLIQCMIVQYISFRIIISLLYMLIQCMLVQDIVNRNTIVLLSRGPPFCSRSFGKTNFYNLWWELKYRVVRIGMGFVRVECVSVCMMCIGRYGESAVRAIESWQVTYRTVRRVCEWLVHSRACSRGARRAGTEAVLLVVRAGVVMMGSLGSHKAGRSVSWYRLCKEDTARELNKPTCTTSAGKCWDRIGTSMSVVFTLFYDG